MGPSTDCKVWLFRLLATPVYPPLTSCGPWKIAQLRMWPLAGKWVHHQRNPPPYLFLFVTNCSESASGMERGKTKEVTHSKMQKGQISAMNHKCESYIWKQHSRFPFGSNQGFYLRLERGELSWGPRVTKWQCGDTDHDKTMAGGSRVWHSELPIIDIADQVWGWRKETGRRFPLFLLRGHSVKLNFGWFRTDKKLIPSHST